MAADRTGAIVLRAWSEDPGELPDPDEARANFDAALLEEPKRVDAQMFNLRKALGG